MIKIALPKGRLGMKVYGKFEEAGYKFDGITEKTRRLIFVNEELNMSCFWVKPYDVPTYIERGSADIGVCGKDILMERKPDIYELADLKTGICTIASAGKEGFIDDVSRKLRIATEFPNITRDYYSSKGRMTDIITLRGSLEIAPILGLSDVIVDIVETGTTLRENNLCVIETICTLSARLVANKSSYQFKRDEILEIKRRLTEC